MEVEEASPVSRYLDALNTRDAENIRGVLAPDFVFEEVAGPGEPSIQALLEELRHIYRAFPDIQFRPVRQTVDINRVYVEFRAIGTHQGEFLDVPATGTLAIVSGVFNLESSEREIRRLRLTVDFGGLRRQLLLAARRA